jgi:hypothetical protein
VTASVASPPKADSRPSSTNAVIKVEISECNDSCKRGSPCVAFAIALTSPVKTKPDPLSTRIGCFDVTAHVMANTSVTLVCSRRHSALALVLQGVLASGKLN